MEDIKAILDPAIKAKAVAPNDLRDIVGKVLNKPLGPFDGDEYNKPILTNSQGNAVGSLTGEIDLEKAYGKSETSELAATLRRLIKEVRS